MKLFDSVPLQDEVKQQVTAIEQADVVVGIPSYNNARTIDHVVHAVQAGLAKYFPSHRCVLVNSDGGSKDGTSEIVRQTGNENLAMILVKHPQIPVHKIVTGYHGIPGKGSAFRTIFAIAARLQAKACCVVDSDLRSITPEWIELLLDPVLDNGFDFVAPLYQRHKFDGTITNSIIYPLTRALYGQRIRQPIGGDFGFSGRLAQHYLSKNVWDTDVARFGIDIWMTTTAISDGFQVCQSYLGAKLHDAKDPSADLTAMFTQVVGSVFGLMEAHEKAWAPINGSRDVPAFGFHYQVGLEPVRVNVDRMLENFRLGCRELVAVWEKILAPAHLTGIVELAAVAKEQFLFNDELWVQTVYDFVLAHHQRRLPYEHLLRSLIPLYLGRTASFVLEMMESSAEEVEARIEKLCLVYEQWKPAFLQNWLGK